MKTLKFIKIIQPIGEYYLGSIKAKDIVNNIDILRRKDHEDYVQRDDNKDRVKGIAKYCKDPDLTFPTPIIISVDSEKISIDEINSLITFNDSDIIGHIIDGQHRVLGIRLAIKENNTIGDFDIPVIFMLDLEAWEKAYVFSTVNHNQKQVPASLIYDLFSLINIEYRSPTATCHVLAKTFNADEKSPFYRKLKMLGNKTSTEELLNRLSKDELKSIITEHDLTDANIKDELSSATTKEELLAIILRKEVFQIISKIEFIKKLSRQELLSQGTFVKYILKYLISKDPQEDEIRIKKNMKLEPNVALPLRAYFIDNEDEYIYKILLNYFISFKKVYSTEWNDSENFLLTRSIGFGVMIRILVKILELAFEENDLREEFFEKIIQKFKNSNINFKITTHTSGGLESTLYKEMLAVLE